MIEDEDAGFLPVSVAVSVVVPAARVTGLRCTHLVCLVDIVDSRRERIL